MITVDRQISADSDRVARCYDHLAQTLCALVATRTLHEGQQAALAGTVNLFLDHRDTLLADFAAVFTDDELEAYKAAHAAVSVTEHAQALEVDGEESPSPRAEIDLLDEALHFYSLVRLTTLTGVETEGHLERTSAYSRAISETLDCDPGFCSEFAYAALLHDVGLVGVPAQILNKRGRVDGTELQVIDTHTKVGAFLINSIVERLGAEQGPLTLAAEIALYHHERYDGLGPHGLSGSAIPYAVRIFQYCDVYDTLRRERPYREAVDHATAVEVIRSANDGEAYQFDPGLMPAFLHTAARFEEIFAA